MDEASRIDGPPDGSAPDQSCPNCGLTRADLYENGRMGCAVCYETFETEVLHALWLIHGGAEHIGKA